MSAISRRLLRARHWWRAQCYRKASAALAVEERAFARMAQGEQGQVEMTATLANLSAELWMALSGDRTMRGELLEMLGREVD